MIHCREVFKQKNDELICVALLYPQKAEIAELEKIKLFAARCHKLMTSISTTSTATFYSRTGSNFIKQNSLPTLWLFNIQPINESLEASGDTTFRFRFESAIRLSVKTDEHMAEAASKDVPKLPPRRILGTAQN